MKTLYESILNDTETTIQKGDAYFGSNTFPTKKDFKSHPILKGSRCAWLFPGFKIIYEKELKNYLSNAIGQSNWLKQYDEITGISVHVKKEPAAILDTGEFHIYVYLEGIKRGSLTAIGVIIKDIEGERNTLAKAKDAAYDFLCKIKDDENFFKNVLKKITGASFKWVI